jgi:copper homeostasis protein
MCIVLEICVDSVEGASAAQAGGANRIELCRSLHEGGLTPGEELLRAVRSEVDLPVHVMIRPRCGNFNYSAYEIDAMMREIESVQSLGADGVVLGVLTPEMEVDVEALRSLIDAAGSMQVTFHRAFDISPSLDRSLEEIIAAGTDRILTSGGERDAAAGATRLAELVSTAHGRLGIMAGGGVRLENVRELALVSGVREIHTSLRQQEECRHARRNEVIFRTEPEPPSHSCLREGDVRAMRKILDQMEITPAPWILKK